MSETNAIYFFRNQAEGKYKQFKFLFGSRRPRETRHIFLGSQGSGNKYADKYFGLRNWNRTRKKTLLKDQQFEQLWCLMHIFLC